MIINFLSWVVTLIQFLLQGKQVNKSVFCTKTVVYVTFLRMTEQGIQIVLYTP